MRRIGFMAAALCAATLAVPAAELSLRGDRLTLQAKDEPLKSVLQLFTRAGISVRLDPDVGTRVTADYRDTDSETALKSILGGNGYTLTWFVIDGPVGPVTSLSEIQVFKPGRRDRALLVDAGGPRLRLTRGRDGKGPLHVEREVLVTLRPGVSREDFMKMLAAMGATLIGGQPDWGIYRVLLPPGADAIEAARQLEKDPRVRGAEPNYAYRMPSPGADRAGAPPAPASGTTPAIAGSPSVAVLDSGLSLPQGWTVDLAATFDAIDPGGSAADPVGHGTQMALVAGGTITPEGAPVSGAAPVIAIRSFDTEGIASNYDLLRAIGFAMDSGARVVSLSWGTDSSSAFLADAIEDAQAKGALVIAAAGNEPTGTAWYPAAFPGVVAVAATEAGGQTWSQSNYGDFITVAAPGYTTMPVGYQGPPGRYAGTSAAAAYTANLAARWLAKNPNATAAEAATALKTAASDAGAKGYDVHYGNGVLDAAAVNRLLGTK